MYIEDFLKYLEFEKRYSPHTITSYSTDLIQFKDFISSGLEKLPLEEIGYKIVRLFILSQIEVGVDNKSVTRKISTLKSYFKFLQKQGYISNNPMLKIITPKLSKKLPVFIDEEKIADLLNGKYFDEGFSGVRNRLIIELFYLTGIRLAELVNLNVSDLDDYNNTIKVLGKGNKERIIPVTKNIIKLFQEYFAECEKANLKLDGKIFVTEKGNNIYPKLVYRVVNDYLDKITTIEKKSPHVLRHTFATHMLNNGADLNSIKELLGHSSLAATQVYTHNTIEKLKSIYKQAHPRA